MKTVKFEIMMDIEDGAFEQLKILEHHADRLLDLDSWPEIRRVYGCKVTVSDGAVHDLEKKNEKLEVK